MRKTDDTKFKDDIILTIFTLQDLVLIRLMDLTNYVN